MKIFSFESEFWLPESVDVIFPFLPMPTIFRSLPRLGYILRSLRKTRFPCSRGL